MSLGQSDDGVVAHCVKINYICMAAKGVTSVHSNVWLLTKASEYYSSKYGTHQVHISGNYTLLSVPSKL